VELRQLPAFVAVATQLHVGRAAEQLNVGQPTLSELVQRLEPAWRTVPSWFPFSSEDRSIPAAAHRFVADRAGSRRTVELAGGSHPVAIPEAARVVDLIEDAVISVAAPAHH
jgi:hypothetical protein